MEVIDTLVSSIDNVLGDKALSREVARQLCRDFGGEQVYIPQKRSAFREDIQDEIYQEYLRTANVKALARKWGMTASQIYRITKEVAARRKQARKPVQGVLFPEEEELPPEG